MEVGFAMRDYRLHELSTHEFQELVIQICREVLGMGTINFSEGPDGGRDGKFVGTANCFPSTSNPWNGQFIIQAKKENDPNASCSDANFKTKILDKEIPKIKRLKENKEIDNYLLFTNRKLSGEAHIEKTRYLKVQVALKNVEIIGIETITSWLNKNPSIVRTCKLDRNRDPLRFHPDQLKDVIVAFYKSRDQVSDICQGRYSFEYVNIEDKNEINKLSEQYFKYIKDGSESYFEQITKFLKQPINEKFTEFYYNTVDELKSKITIKRNEFAHFEEIFYYLYDLIVDTFPELEPRKLISVFLHYMYCNCDIGEKC